MANSFYDLEKEPIVRSDTIRNIIVVLIILSFFGSIALGHFFRVPTTSSRYNYYSSATSDFNGMLMLYGFVVTFFEGFIWYCVYSHIRTMEEQREYLRRIYSALIEKHNSSDAQPVTSAKKSDAQTENSARVSNTAGDAHKNPIVTYLEQRNNGEA